MSVWRRARWERRVPIVTVDFEALSEGSVEAAGSVAIVLWNG